LDRFRGRTSRRKEVQAERTEARIRPVLRQYGPSVTARKQATAADGDARGCDSRAYETRTWTPRCDRECQPMSPKLNCPSCTKSARNAQELFLLAAMPGAFLRRRRAQAAPPPDCG